MTGHIYRDIDFPKAHLPQPGPRAVRQPRDEPLHPVLPLRPLLPRLRRRARFRRRSPRTTTSISVATEDGVLENEFSGNLVEVCPTGVFTDKTFRAPLHPQVGPPDRPFDLRPLRRSAATRSPASGTVRCAGSATATTARSTATSCATAGGTGTSLSTAADPASVPRGSGRKATPRPAEAGRAGSRSSGGGDAWRPPRSDRDRLAARVARIQFRPAPPGGAGSVFPGGFGGGLPHGRPRRSEILQAGPARSPSLRKCARRTRSWCWARMSRIARRSWRSPCASSSARAPSFPRAGWISPAGTTPRSGRLAQDEKGHALPGNSGGDQAGGRVAMGATRRARRPGPARVCGGARNRSGRAGCDRFAGGCRPAGGGDRPGVAVRRAAARRLRRRLRQSRRCCRRRRTWPGRCAGGDVPRCFHSPAGSQQPRPWR